MTEPEQPVVAVPRVIEEAAAAFEASAKTWYRHAEEARRDGTVSSIRGHNGIPSEVTAVVRAMTWEAAAVDLRARVEGQPVVAQPLRAALEHLWTVRAAPIARSRTTTRAGYGARLNCL